MQQPLVYEARDRLAPGGGRYEEGGACNGGNQSPSWALIARLVSYDQAGIARGMQATLRSAVYPRLTKVIDLTVESAADVLGWIPGHGSQEMPVVSEGPYI